MRKTELPNCPQWLLNADTENESVEWNNINQNYIVWHGGEWLGDEWCDGEWRGGVWLGGVWHGGETTAKSNYMPTIFAGKIKIGCKINTVADWDKWFSCTEEFATPRNTEAFKMIWAHYCAVKTYGQIMGLLK